MIQLIFWAAFLVSIIVAVMYMLKVRRAGEQDPMMTDGLTVGERILAIITIFFGGVIIGGSIFYYGWKRRFPLKAKSVLYIEWIFIALVFIIFGVVAYGQYVRLNSIKESIDIQQQYQEQKQESTLTSSPLETYTGTGYSIGIPTGWAEESSLDSNGSDYFVKNWGITTGNSLQRITVSWTRSTNPDASVRYAEANALDSVATRPETFTLSHPSVIGAKEQTNMVESRTNTPTDFYNVDFFVHGSGNNRYQINGTLLHPTSAQIDALKKAILSFQLTQ